MNKFKLKIPVKKVGNYLRDFSIVVAGIAVTLWVQSWLTTRSDKKDMALYMNALKLEMENNRLLLDSVLVPTMKASMEYIYYISTHDKRSISKDSLQHYDGVYNNISDMSFLYSAFETFKTSGSIRFIDDKELLQSIWHTYTQLNGFEVWIKQYYHDKWEEMKREKHLEIEGKQVDIPMYNFYMTNGFYDGIEANIIRNSEIYSKKFKELIAEIEVIQ